MNKEEKLVSIINSYSRKMFPETNPDKALFEYERFCIELIEENKELKEKIKYYENPINYFKYSSKNVVDENKQLKVQLEEQKKINEEHQKLNGELRKKNQELKNSLDMYAEVLDTTEKEKTREEIIHIQLQNRIDKAIEYLDDWLFNVGGLGACMEYRDIKEILEIIKGDSMSKE